MRRLSDGVEAALHCALLLAALEEEHVLPARSLAEFHGVSETYLLKHLRALAANGIVDAVPGPRGGYRLARQPESITLLDVVEAIDGKGPAFVCREIRRRGPGLSKDPCTYRSDCFIKTRMLAAEAVWRSALREQTVADLVRDGQTQIDEQNSQAVMTFIEKRQR